jgi:UDP-3-O-[3-hydroxymyristoyl] N-acetylglucosamine deacetylase
MAWGRPLPIMQSMKKQNAFHSPYQHRLKRVAVCEGVGLHTGTPVKLSLHPAPADTGIIFYRSDLPGSSAIPARAAQVSETRLGTSLTANGISIATVEHLMAALWGMGIDNALITLNGPEVPIMDGSSQPFITLIRKAGLKRQSAPRQFLEVTAPVSVEMGDSRLEILPYDGFRLDIEVDYTHPEIGRQFAAYDFSRDSFADSLSRARTFGFAHEVEALKKMGLARGGSLANAIVLDETRILNEEGLRFDDEFVRHKALDCLGDLFLTGYRLRGRILARKPGHQINTMLANTLLENRQKWQLAEFAEASPAHSLFPSLPRLTAGAEAPAFA